MKTVTILTDIESINLEELAELIAYARFPGEDEYSKKSYELARTMALTEVHIAADDGSLSMINPLTGMVLPPITKHSDPIEAVLHIRRTLTPKHGQVTIDETRRYLELRGIAVEIESAAPAPDTQPQAEPEATPAKAGTAKRWTPEALAELKAYRGKHTEAETAKQFGVSGQRVRVLLAEGKSTGKPKASPFSGMVHRIK